MNKIAIAVGQRVHWNDPEDGACSCDATVVEVWLDDGTVVLKDDDGDIVFAHTHELTTIAPTD